MGLGKPRLLAGLALGVAVSGGLAAAWAGGLILHDTSTPASVAEALTRFRVVDPQPAEEDGVYVYRTRGGESVDALGGARHRYPGTTSITATATRCGVELRWDALEGRSTSWRLCRGTAGVVLRTYSETHRFFGRQDRTTYRCAGTVVRPTSAFAGERLPFRCSSGRGIQTGVALVVAARGDDVHVRTTGTVNHGDRGTEVVEWWFAHGSTIPVRLVVRTRTSREEFIGRVAYREDAVLRLRSSSPRR
jgi:hypothetical protein